MGIQQVKPTSFNLAMSADGGMCLTLQSGTGTFEVYVKAELWAQLGKSAGWFDQNISQQDLIARLAAERENALTREREIGSQLRAMTEARNELATKLEIYETEENNDEEG